MKCLLIRYSLHKRTEHPRPRQCSGALFYILEIQTPHGWLEQAFLCLDGHELNTNLKLLSSSTDTILHRSYIKITGGLDKVYQEIAFFCKEEERGIRTSTVYGQSSLNRNNEDTARPQTGAKSSPAKIHTALNFSDSQEISRSLFVKGGGRN